MKIKILVFVFGIITVLALPLSGLADEGPLVVYSGRGERFTKPVLRAFTKKTGIPTLPLVGNAGALLVRLTEEGKRTRADVFISNSAGILELAREAGVLTPFNPKVKLPSHYLGAENTWFAASVRARAIVYNKNLIKGAEIKSLLDLAQPRWKGKLGITVSTNGSFVGGVAAMISQYGEKAVGDFLKGIALNAGNNTFPKHTPIVSAVARGEIALGLINHYYYYRHLKKFPGAPIGILFPDQDKKGTPSTVSGLALVKHGKNRSAAKKFIDFVLSPEGQKVYAEVNYEFPVNAQVFPHKALPKRGEVKLLPSGLSQMTKQLDTAVALIKAARMH